MIDEKITLLRPGTSAILITKTVLGEFIITTLAAETLDYQSS
jgi:hypothetical protein